MIRLKTPGEINKIEYVCRITGELLVWIKDYVKDGVSTKDLDSLIRERIKDKKCVPAFLGYGGFPASACISINEEVVHGIPSCRKILSGDIVSIDVGLEKDGYYSDSAVTYAVGDVTELNLKLMDSTYRSLKAGIENVKVGNRISDISRAVEGVVRADGFEVVRDLVGHGVGLEVHEDPAVPNYFEKNRKPDPIIEEGLVVAIEPMVNIGGYEVYTDPDDKWTVITEDGKPSAHFEHTVAVVDGKPKVLTEVA